MIDFEIRSKTQTVGDKAGQTVYYAWPKTVEHMSNDELIEHIVDATSLTKGDVKNALVSLSNVVYEAMRSGQSVDLAELGRLRVTVTSKMVDSAEEVTASVLKTPKISFTPKREMLDAAKSVKVRIDHSYVKEAKSTESSGEGDGSSSGSGGDDTEMN